MGTGFTGRPTIKKLPLPTPEEKINTLMQYFELAEKYEVAKPGLFVQKAHMFTKNLKNSAKVRNELNNAKTKGNIIKIIEKYKEEF